MSVRRKAKAVPDALRLAWRVAQEVEAARDRAVADGDRGLAHALHFELEGRARDIDHQLAVHARLIREARAAEEAAPSDTRRGGALVRTSIPGVDQATGRVVSHSVPDGALARPVWALDMAPELKWLASRYAATVELCASGGGIKGIDPSMIRVDGGGAGVAPGLSLLDHRRRRDVAWRVLSECEGLNAVRAGQAGRLQSVSARAIVDQVAIEGLAVCDVLAKAGWSRYGKNKRKVKAVLVSALEAIAAAWGGHEPGEVARGGVWTAPYVDYPARPREEMWYKAQDIA